MAATQMTFKPPSSNQFFPTMPYMPSPGNSSSSGPNNIFAIGTPDPTGNPFLPSGPDTSNQPVAMTPRQDISFNFPGPATGPGSTGIGKGMFAENPLNPALTNAFFNYLFSNIGQGVPSFPGSLSANMDPTMQQFMKLFMPGGAIGDMAANGVNAVPTWQNMVDAMQRQIGQGAANLKEQFNVSGNLSSSPMGSAMVDYFTQSNKDLNSLLGNLTFQGIQDQLQAANMSGSAANMFQGLDQAAIDRMYQEFIRTSPQYNPLLGMEFGAATTFPPMFNPKTGMGGLGALLGGGGQLAGGLASLFSLFGGGGAGGAAAGLGELAPDLIGFCWVAEVLYGKDDQRTELVRKWLRDKYSKTEAGAKVVGAYIKHGRTIAELAKQSKELRDGLMPYFDKALTEARRVYA